MFELGSGDALEIPANLQSFHEEVLIENCEAALAISLHEKMASYWERSAKLR